MMESWAIIYEEPVRKRIRSRLGDFLGVPGSQFPLRDFLKVKVPR